MKKVLLVALMAASFSASANTFTFVAPSSPGQAPALSTLANVLDAFKSIGTAWGLNDAAATETLDNAARDVTLAIKIQQADTANVNAPVYSNGTFSWTNNAATAMSSAMQWVQTDQAGYDAAALSFRDAGGNYAVTATMTGTSGVNRLMSAVDGQTRTVNGADYTPLVSYNSSVTAFNAATDVDNKIMLLSSLETALANIQAQGAAIDTAGAATSTVLNSMILPAAGRDSASFSNLDDLLTYHALHNLQ